MPSTKVLIVTESSTLAQVLSAALAHAPVVRVVGAAGSEESAREMIRAHDPEVLVVDLETMRFDAISFITKLMRARPIPIVATFSLHAEGIDAAVRALEAGAVDFVSKPDRDIRKHLAEVSRKIVERVVIAAGARPQSPSRIECLDTIEIAEDVVDIAPIAIGACTGGPDALRQFLAPLPDNAPPIVVVQHMPAQFTASLAWRLDACSTVRVFEAKHGQRLERGAALLAPGNFHMRVVRDAGGMCVELDQSPSVHHHRPAIDTLFQSVARECGSKAVGVLLTGSGADGAKGLRAMRDAGARTLGQDERSAVQYENLRHAQRELAIEESVSLIDLPRRAVELACSVGSPRASALLAELSMRTPHFAVPRAYAQFAGVEVAVSAGLSYETKPRNTARQRVRRGERKVR